MVVIGDYMVFSIERNELCVCVFYRFWFVRVINIVQYWFMSPKFEINFHSRLFGALARGSFIWLVNGQCGHFRGENNLVNSPLSFLPRPVIFDLRIPMIAAAGPAFKRHR